MSQDVPVATAALLIIGNEILSGRTQDVNLNFVAKTLASVGIPLQEVRVVPDVESAIVEAVNALRSTFTYLFTTGGIGPTHDDITVDSIASAFEVAVTTHPEARRLLEEHYGLENLTDARLRMARVPEGARLIANPVSKAPGIQLDNVYIMAGVPNIMQAMLEGVVATLRHGPLIKSLSVSGAVAESVIADELRSIAQKFPQLDIGSYPWVKDGRFGTALVTRGTDEEAVKISASLLRELIRAKGAEPIPSEG